MSARKVDPAHGPPDVQSRTETTPPTLCRLVRVILHYLNDNQRERSHRVYLGGANDSSPGTPHSDESPPPPRRARWGAGVLRTACLVQNHSLHRDKLGGGQEVN